MDASGTSLPRFMGRVSELRPGDAIGRYRILDQLGHGGMGMTFLVRHELKDVKEVLKLINPELANRVGREMFLREIRTLAKLSPDPRYGEVLSADEITIDGTSFPFLVMSYVEGAATLDRPEVLATLSLRERMALFVKVCEAVQALHEKNPTLVHRDLKPTNILVSSEGNSGGWRVKIIDFGIAVWPMQGLDDPVPTACGTRGFSSPEQSLRGALVTQASDVYSLGAILDWLVGESPRTPPLRRIIAKAMQTRPELRFAQACAGPASRSLGGAVAALLRHRSPAVKAAGVERADVDPNAPTVEQADSDRPARMNVVSARSGEEWACSLAYRTRRWSWSLAAMLSAVFVQACLVTPVFEWSSLGARFEGMIQPANPLAGLKGALSSVRIIAITDQTATKFAEADREDLANAVLPQSQSYLWDHTELLRRLRGQRASAVVFDMRHPETLDQLPPERRVALTLLLAELEREGTQVVMGGKWTEAKDRADRPGYWIASPSANVDPGRTTIPIDMAVQVRRTGEVIPSMNLLGLLFAQHADTRPMLSWNHRANLLNAQLLSYGPGIAPVVSGRRSFKLTNEFACEIPEPEVGLEIGDIVGYLEIAGLASPEVLAASTVDYADAALGTVSEMNGRVALVIDVRSGCADKHDVMGYGVAPGGHIVASGIESMALGRWLRDPDEWDTAWIVLASASLGALLVVGIARVRRQWGPGVMAMAVATGCGLVVAVCVISSVYWLYRVNPILPGVAAVLGGTATVVLSFLSRRWADEYGVME